METYCLRLTQTLANRAAIRTVVLAGNSDGSVPGIASLVGFGFRAFFQILTGPRASAVHLGDMAIWPMALAARLRHPRARLVATAHVSDVSFPLRGGIAGRAYAVYLRLGPRYYRA